MERDFSPRYRGPIRVALCFQAASLVVGSLTLDHGRMRSGAVLSIAVYWLSAGLILRNRPRNPSRWDLIYLRSGFVVIFAVLALLSGILSS